MALAMLPVDGTLLGVPLPYWTPLSPWFFLAYALSNWRYLRLTLRKYLPFFLFPVLLAVTSIYGWQTVAMHANAIALSFVSILLGLACLASLDIAFARKRLPIRASLTVVVCTYWFAFAVGVAQFIALKLQSDATLHYFAAMMYRRYIRVRPQFLFAEPSYTGMHLFGVLLPLFWLTRDRRFAVLIPVFAAGAIAMGSGTRIIIDSAVALFLWLVSAVNFRNRKATWGFIAGSSAIAAGGLLATILEPRLNALATRGLLAGDGSMSARIFHMLAPMWSWKHDLLHFLFGWGSGNISDAVRDGYAGARQWFDAHGGAANQEINGLVNPHEHLHDERLFQFHHGIRHRHVRVVCRHASHPHHHASRLESNYRVLARPDRVSLHPVRVIRLLRLVAAHLRRSQQPIRRCGPEQSSACSAPAFPREALTEKRGGNPRIGTCARFVRLSMLHTAHPMSSLLATHNIHSTV